MVPTLILTGKLSGKLFLFLEEVSFFGNSRSLANYQNTISNSVGDLSKDVIQF